MRHKIVRANYMRHKSLIWVYWIEIIMLKLSDAQIKPFNPDSRLFLNINTPEDLNASRLADK